MNSDLSKLISTASNARLRLRLLAVSHFIDGKNRTEIVSFLKVSRLSVNKWIKSGGGRLQGGDIIKFILDEFDVSYQPSSVYRLLHELNLSWITTRSKHPKQSEEAQESFKKISNRNDP